MKIWNKILLFAIAVSIGIIYRKETGDWSYVVLLVGSIGSLALFMLKKKAKLVLFYESNTSALRYKSYAFRYLSVCWFFIFISWVYGVLIGLINFNELGSIFRNFFGLNLYLLMPVFFTLKPKKKHLYVAVAAGCAIQCVIALYEFYQVGFVFNPMGSISSSRFFYSVGLITAIPFFSYYLSRFLFPRQFSPFEEKATSVYFDLSLALLLSFFIIFPPASKGFILAWIFALLYVVGLYLWSYIFKGRVTVRGLWFLLVLFLVLMLISYHFYDLIAFSFSDQDVSNAERNDQFHLILEDFNFIGHGLGALLSSGYVRDETGYGMELTYLNLIHKLGLVSIFLFLSYLCTYYLAIKIGLNNKRIYESCFAFGGMGFSIIGAGNPLLLSPAAVTLHCVVMYILLSENSNEKRDY